MSLPGGPFLFGALLAFVALLVTLSLPEVRSKPVDIKKKTDEDDTNTFHQDSRPLLFEA